MNRLVAFISLALLAASPALAQNTYKPGGSANVTAATPVVCPNVSTGAPADCHGPLPITETVTYVTQTTGGTAQDVLAALTARKIFCVQVEPSNTTDTKVAVNATASATLGTRLMAGTNQQTCTAAGLTGTARVSVWNATTGAAYNVYSGQ